MRDFPRKEMCTAMEYYFKKCPFVRSLTAEKCYNLKVGELGWIEMVGEVFRGIFTYFLTELSPIFSRIK